MNADLADIGLIHDLRLAKEGDSEARERIIKYMGNHSSSNGRPNEDRAAQRAYELNQAIKVCKGFEVLPRSNASKVIAQETGTTPGTVKKQLAKVARQVAQGDYVPLKIRRAATLNKHLPEAYIIHDIMLATAYDLLTGKAPPPELFKPFQG